MTRALGILGLLVGVGLLIQFVPLDRSNPPIESDIPTPPDVKVILKRACYDCHSHETVWPWYSQLAPVSWLVARDVHEGRAELNFSTWQRYNSTEQGKKLKESWEEIQDGEMPPRSYLLVHQDAALSDTDRQVLHTWVLSSGNTPHE